MNPKVKYYVWMFTLAIACFFAYEFAEKLFSEQKSSSKNPIVSVISQPGSGQPKIGGPFKLVDHKGISRTNADFKGKFMLVYFGYSFCPEICPTALYNITQALNMLGEKKNSLNTIFITIDPERDDKTQLAIYQQNFHPSITMLTGSSEDVTKAIKEYRVYAVKAKPDGTSSEYLMDHSSIVYLMDKQGRYLTSFNHETDPNIIVKKLSQYIK